MRCAIPRQVSGRGEPSAARGGGKGSWAVLPNDPLANSADAPRCRLAIKVTGLPCDPPGASALWITNEAKTIDPPPVAPDGRTVAVVSNIGRPFESPSFVSRHVPPRPFRFASLWGRPPPPSARLPRALASLGAWQPATAPANSNLVGRSQRPGNPRRRRSAIASRRLLRQSTGGKAAQQRKALAPSAPLTLQPKCPPNLGPPHPARSKSPPGLSPAGSNCFGADKRSKQLLGTARWAGVFLQRRRRSDFRLRGKQLRRD